MQVDRQGGIGLVEVLVALVVVSFGVLGVASLQLTGIKHSTSGFNRSKALMLTENMATRMRINLAGVEAGHYNGFDSSASANYCDTRPNPYCQAYKGGTVASCSAEELADFDTFSVSCGDWGTNGANAGVQGMLPPDAKLEIDCNDSPCTDLSTYSVSISWPEAQNASSDEDPETRSVLMRLRP